MYIFGYCSWGLYIVRETGHRQCWVLYAKQATDSGPGLHSRRLPPDGWWPLAVTGGLVSLVCVQAESRRVWIDIKLLGYRVTILQYSPGNDVIVSIIAV